MRAFYFLALAMLMSSTAFSQADTTNFNEPYYVVIGAFSVQKNASRFTRQAPKYDLSAKSALNHNRNLYYVYVLSTDDRTKAIDEALKLRARPDSMYSDAWVYHGPFKKSEQGEIVKGNDIDPAVEQKKNVAAITAQSVTAKGPATEKEVTKEVIKEDTKPFLFKISRLDDSSAVSGDVLVVDVALARKIGTYDGNKTVYVPKPKSVAGKIAMTCLVFGYRKIQHNLNYINPEGDSVEIQEDSTIVVPFQLMRLQKGDVAVMYDVYFFKDAAIMRPESRYEVGSLVEMMKENPKYKIKIHGHTNGGAHGKIITMKETPGDYFSLNNTKEGFGSAKNLSKARAELLRTFLVNNGIDEKQLVIKAWGGKKPIYDKMSPQAQSNVRVEIEILEN